LPEDAERGLVARRRLLIPHLWLLLDKCRYKGVFRIVVMCGLASEALCRNIEVKPHNEDMEDNEETDRGSEVFPCIQKYLLSIHAMVLLSSSKGMPLKPL
jgi:hypothetical protein